MHRSHLKCQGCTGTFQFKYAKLCILIQIHSTDVFQGQVSDSKQQVSETHLRGRLPCKFLWHNTENFAIIFVLATELCTQKKLHTGNSKQFQLVFFLGQTCCSSFSPGVQQPRASGNSLLSTPYVSILVILFTICCNFFFNPFTPKI